MAKTIFLIDDEPAWLSALSEALEQQNFKVISSENGEDALAKLKKMKPDLILSDVRMPVMNGFDLFERIRSEPKLKNIPYIFMSSIDDYDAKRVAKELGADDYVTKPYSTEDVKNIMSNLMKRLNL
ncbi:MAG: PleD family two-component system response regulator [Bacteroidota bacterium]